MITAAQPQNPSSPTKYQNIPLSDVGIEPAIWQALESNEVIDFENICGFISAKV
jgi:hypothetical protein